MTGVAVMLPLAATDVSRREVERALADAFATTASRLRIDALAPTEITIRDAPDWSRAQVRIGAERVGLREPDHADLDTLTDELAAAAAVLAPALLDEAAVARLERRTPGAGDVVRDLLELRVALTDPEEMHDTVSEGRESPYWHAVELLADRWRPRGLRLAIPPADLRAATSAPDDEFRTARTEVFALLGIPCPPCAFLPDAALPRGGRRLWVNAVPSRRWYSPSPGHLGAATALTGLVTRHAHVLLDRTVVAEWLRSALGPWHRLAALADDSVGLSLLTRLVRSLLLDGAPAPSISWAAGLVAEERQRPCSLAGSINRLRRRLAPELTAGAPLPVLTVARSFVDAAQRAGEQDPTATDAVLEAVRAAFPRGRGTLVVPSAVRARLRRTIVPTAPGVRVLGDDEIDPVVSLCPTGAVSVPA